VVPPPRRGMVVAIEGLSGAGKSRLLRSARREAGVRVLDEAWVRLHPRPSLAFASALELARLELRLFREDLRRWSEAHRATSRGEIAVCDTDFLGPALYVGALSGFDPALSALAHSMIDRMEAALDADRWGPADHYVYLDTPASTARRRAGRAPRDHPLRWRERHARVGALERAFWLGSVPSLLPGRVHVLDGRARPTRIELQLRAVLHRPRPRASPRAGRRLLGGLRRFVDSLG
jgi:thymidylate kinase